VTLSFESLYEIEWDWDFAFLLVSTDGINWQALPSLENTTLDGFNPNGWECYDRYGHGITGASRVAPQERNLLTNSNRATGSMSTPEWMTDRFDLSAFAGQDIIVRFTYFTDPAVAFRGWFIDDIKVEADGETVYASDFEDDEDGRLFSHGWAHVNTSTGREVDHAYYIEVRDRVSNDFDSKGQSDRGAPTWEPGVAILYTDENHGYGNTGVDNPPAQTIVDAVPDPGNDTPNLDDAAFTAAAGRNVFDGCTHVDNYDNTAGDHPDGYWKLPEGLRMTVDALSVVGPQAAVSDTAHAVLTVDAYPTCLDLEAPELALGADYGDPDMDGAYTLDWTLSANAIGPNVLQEATVLADLFTDNAESGLGATWTTEMYDSCGPDPIGMAPWTTNTGKWESEVQSFFATTTDAVYGATCADYHSVMQTASAVSIPADGGTVLSFFDAIGGELDDRGAVEISSDNGQTWEEVYATSGPLFLDENAAFLADTSLRFKEVDLTEFAGQDVLIRFNYSVGASNYIAYAPIGWWVDDITVSTANWEDVAEVVGTSFLRDGRTNGTYHYRVKTRYPGSPVAVDSPWSNIVTANVTGVMNRAPVAHDDAETTNYQTAVTIDVLTNDTDADGDALSVASVTQGTSGTVTNNGSSVTYTPNTGFSGMDTFTYVANDGSEDSNAATVTVTVLGPGNRKPEAGDDMAGTEFETAVTIDVLVNDSDPDGDSLSVATVGTATNSTVVNNTTDVTYTPNSGFSGTDSFTYTVSDGNGGSDEATVTVTVAEQGNRQPGAMDDAASTDQDTPVAIDVLANDSDPDSDPLTITDVSDPANGSVTNNSGKTVTYTPDPGFFGTDTFTYTVADGRNGEDTATVTVTVYETGANHAPKAKDDKVKTPKNTEIVIYVTANDNDSDGDVLTVDGFTQGEHGLVSPVGDDALRYVPDQDYVGNDEFTYTVSDG
ncbi:MAG: tandem-95 repeat protein, partial [Gammaproteobacteria bacterium]|nr:tandem-95 repeat protein [Gammaproteobacteria bacterium]